MKVSFKWLNEWVDLSEFENRPTGAQEIADILTARGLEVESVTRQDQGLDKVVTVQIIDKQKHPEADRLSLCKVNPGSEIKNALNNGEYFDIVCGAQNMKVGDIVVLAMIGAQLPNGLKIEKSKIRGVISNGMLCSETELGMKESSDGILILPEKTPTGWKIADVLGLDDVIFEIKLTANRGDCLSHRGLARELASALGKPLKTPKISTLDFSDVHSPSACKIKVELGAGDDAPQFFGCYIEGVKVEPSPSWLKNRLEAIGQRSINNIVDVSNFLMFEYGFPVHIYDADKIEGGILKVRKSKKGETLKLLDQINAPDAIEAVGIEMIGEELLIVDGVKPVGLAGVMGGGNSEVCDTTERVFLECAEFNPTLVRRAAFRHGRRSEASLRFEKGIDPAGLKEAISRLSDLVIKVASGSKGAEVKGACFAQSPSRAALAQYSKLRAIQTSAAEINSFLGTSLGEEQILKILKSLECAVEIAPDRSLKIIPPSYRLDLVIPQDIAEEVARCVGYDAIPSTIPVLTCAPKSRQADAVSHRQKTIETMKDALVDQGLSEVLNYSFQSEAWLEKFSLKSKVKILNPISEEQGFMVPSLLPGMLKAYQENERHHFGSEPLAVRLFEIRPVFDFNGEGEIAAKNEMETGIIETWKCSFLISGPRYDQAIKSERGDVDFYDLKSIVETLFESISVKGIRLKVLSVAAPLFHSGQSIEVFAGKESIGTFGRIHPKLENDLKLRAPVYWGELNLEPVISLTSMKNRQFKAWSSFPIMERDFALLVKEQVLAENLIQSAVKHGKPIAKVVKIFDTYRGTHIPDGMISIGVRVIFSDETKSLEEKQVDQCAELIVKKWEEEFDAKQR